MTGAGDGEGDGSGSANGMTTGSGAPENDASSSCDAPQFRQNFAAGDTGFPHSGQNGIIISTEWLNVIPK